MVVINLSRRMDGAASVQPRALKTGFIVEAAPGLTFTRVLPELAILHVVVYNGLKCAQ
jgi:hypothetical protein